MDTKYDLVVHIGSYKTGTSHFQNTCFDNRKALRKNGLIYPLIATDKDRKHIGNAHRYILKRKKAIPTLISKMEQNPEKTFLLSWEGLSHPKRIPAIEKVDLFTNKTSHKVKVIFVIRPYIDYAISLYRQFSKARGLVDDFPLFLQNKKQPHNWDYIVEKWASFVGPDNFEIINYNDYGRDIGNTILQKTGITENVELDDLSSGISNPSQSPIAAYITRKLNERDLPRNIVIGTAKILKHEVSSIHPEFFKLREISDQEVNLAEDMFGKKMERISNIIDIPFPIDNLLNSKPLNYDPGLFKEYTTIAINELLPLMKGKLEPYKPDVEALL